MCATTYATGVLKRPLTEAELSVCMSIIEKGEAVELGSVRRELPRATFIAIARLDGQIVGVGAIKRRRPTYSEIISKRAGYSFPAETLELGYVAVDPAHRRRRLSYALVTALLTGRDDLLFATTSSDPMKKSLSKGGFVCKGKEWEGNSSRLSLWLRPPQLPK
jgi:GNAT superfamily N-acetyltransferase